MHKTFLFVVCILLSFCGFTQFESVCVDRFEELMIATNNRQLIDIRTPMEFKEGRIPYAKNIDYLNTEFRTKVSRLNREEPVLIYCARGLRSSSAMEIFREEGFQTVFELDGGIYAWLFAQRNPLKNDGVSTTL